MANLTREERLLLNDVLQALREIHGQPKKWMTATGLARKLGHNADRIRRTLVKYAQLEGQRDIQIRYSRYPSMRTLDLLWGYTENPEEWQRLMPLRKTDAERVVSQRPVSDDEVLVFLSHNHADEARALNIRDEFAKEGVNIWMAEVDILCDAIIVDEIRVAFSECDCLAIYLSAHAVDSVWVHKETVVFPEHKLLIIDGDDRELAKDLEADIQGHTPRFSNYRSTFPEFFDNVRALALNKALPVGIYPRPNQQVSLCGRDVVDIQTLARAIPPLVNG